jgi:hypothetical protein
VVESVVAETATTALAVLTLVATETWVARTAVVLKDVAVVTVRWDIVATVRVLEVAVVVVET